MIKYIYVWTYGQGKQEKESKPMFSTDVKHEERYLDDVIQPYVSWIEEKKGTWAELTVWRYDTIFQTMDKIDSFEYSKFHSPIRYLNAKTDNTKSTEEDNIPF
jgi:hypothetical protein